MKGQMNGRVNHIQHAVWRFSQSAQGRKAASSIHGQRSQREGLSWAYR